MPDLVSLNFEKSYLVPPVLFAGATLLFFTKGFSSLILILVFTGLFAAYLPSSFKIAKTGNKILALKTAIASFVPAIGAMNEAFFKFIKSDIFQKYASSAREGSESFKLFLNHVSPEYGDMVYKILIGIIVVGVNFMLIQKFVGIAKKLVGIAVVADKTTR